MIFAYTKEFATEILAEALRRRGWRTLAHDHPEELVLSGAADMALTSPLEYSRSLGAVDIAMAPDVAIMSEGFAGILQLVFNQGLVDLHSMALKRTNSYEVAVASVILSEKHDIALKLVPVEASASLADMLAVADMALLAGDDALFDADGRRSLLDLSDEWGDMAEAALPYRIVWGRVGEISSAALEDLAAARDEAVLMFPDYVARAARGESTDAFYQRYLRGEIRYAMIPSDLAAFDALYRYLFYYGLITDIPALKYLPAGAPAGDPPAGPPKGDGEQSV